MSKFKAQEHAEEMSFDLSDFGGPVGVIPEPTQDQVDEYYLAIDDLRYQIGQRLRMDAKDTVEIEDGVRGLDLSVLRGRAKDGRKAMYEAVEAVTSKAVTVQDLENLPHRIAAAFGGWLFGELSPKDSTSGTSILPEG